MYILVTTAQPMGVLDGGAHRVKGQGVFVDAGVEESVQEKLPKGLSTIHSEEKTNDEPNPTC